MGNREYGRTDQVVWYSIKEAMEFIHEKSLEEQTNLLRRIIELEAQVGHLRQRLDNLLSSSIQDSDG